MRGVTMVAIAGLALALPGCHKNASTTDQNTAAANNLIAPPADIETLPPDESSPTNQLENGVSNDQLTTNDLNDVD